VLSNLWKDKLAVLPHSHSCIEDEGLWHSGNFARGRLGFAIMRMRAALVALPYFAAVFRSRPKPGLANHRSMFMAHSYD
jgi:hypothetical protein